MCYTPLTYCKCCSAHSPAATCHSCNTPTRGQPLLWQHMNLYSSHEEQHVHKDVLCPGQLTQQQPTSRPQDRDSQCTEVPISSCFTTMLALSSQKPHSCIVGGVVQCGSLPRGLKAGICKRKPRGPSQAVCWHVSPARKPLTHHRCAPAARPSGCPPSWPPRSS